MTVGCNDEGVASAHLILMSPVLEDRLNDRVKTMLDNGLMAELNALHCEYLESVLSRNGSVDTPRFLVYCEM